MYPYNKREGVAVQRAERIITSLRMNQFKYPGGVADPLTARVFHSFIEDHAHEAAQGAKYHEQYQYILNLWKEHNMTPLQAATNKRDTLIAERDKNRDNIVEFEEAGATLAERNAVLNTEILALSATIGAEERKEREAKHKAMAEELTAAGYKVAVPIKEGQPILFGIPIAKGKTNFLHDMIVLDPAYQFLTRGCDVHAGISKAMYDSIKQMVTGVSGGGKGGSVTSPVAAAPASAKLGGVHGVGEGWYRPIVYNGQGVKLDHDFAINTRDHHEARNCWWLKHVPSGKITKGFPNEAEAHRWIKGRMAKRAAGVKHPYYAPRYTTNDPHPEVK